MRQGKQFGLRMAALAVGVLAMLVLVGAAMAARSGNVPDGGHAPAAFDGHPPANHDQGPPEDELRAAQARAAQERAFRDSAAGQRERTRSATAYRGLGPSAVLAVLSAKQPAVVDAPVWKPLDLRDGARVTGYPSADTARVRLADGTRVAAVSSLPLRTADGPVDLTLVGGGSGWRTANGLADVTLPADGGGEARVGGLGIGLGGGAGAGRLVDGRVLYPATATDTATVAMPLPTGLEISSELLSRAAPQALRFGLDLPAGASAQADGDGAVRVVRDGETLATIAAPTATDAQGASVPVSQRVADGALVLSVPHRSASYAYPISVDPTVLYNWNTGRQDWTGWGTYESGGPWCLYGGGWYLGIGLYTFDRNVPGEPCTGSYTTGIGEWNYYGEFSTPSYVYETQQYGQLDSGGDAGVCRYSGIFSVVYGWETTSSTVCATDPWQTRTVCAYSACTPDPGHDDNNYVVWGTETPGGGSHPYFTNFQGAATIWVYDRNAPSVSATSPPGGWTDNTSAPATWSASGSDPGLGLQKLAWTSTTAPSWHGSPDYNPGCTANPSQRCPTSTQTAPASAAGLPEGIDTVTATATDVVGGSGHQATVSRTVKVDTTAPTVAYTGDLTTQNASTPLLPGSHTLTVNATDGVQGGAAAQQRSGVAQIQVSELPDAHNRTFTSTCTGDSCPLTATYTVDPNDGTWTGGTHTLRVVTTDRLGHATPPQTYRFTVGGLALPGGQCDHTLASGYADGIYVALGYTAHGSQTDLCFHITNGTTINKDGVVTIDGGPSVTLGQPSYDDDADGCASTPDFDVTLLGEDRVMLAHASDGGGARLCLQAGTQRYRVIVPVTAGTTVPSVIVGADAPPPPPPPMTAWPLGPSAACTSAGGPMLLDATAGPFAAWLADDRPDASSMDLCLRVQGPVAAGGVLHVTAAPGGGTALVLSQGSAWSACDGGQPIVDTAVPAALHVKVGPTGGSTATVCVDDGTVHTYTVGTTGSGGPGYVTWTPDP